MPPSYRAANLSSNGAGSGRFAVAPARRTPSERSLLTVTFRHDPGNLRRFFARIPQEPALAPVRDPLRDLVVAMRKRNLSVYDIQSLFQKPYAAALRRMRLYLKRSRYFAPVSLRSINWIILI